MGVGEELMIADAEVVGDEESKVKTSTRVVRVDMAVMLDCMATVCPLVLVSVL